MRRIVQYSDRANPFATKSEGPELLHTGPSRTPRQTFAGQTPGESSSLSSCGDCTPLPCGKQATMRAISDLSAHDGRVPPNAPAIVLGTSEQTLKSGRYVRLMGTMWRHPKTEQCGDAALGLLMRILSFSADQAVQVISERRMRDLFRGSPHGRRSLNELTKAGFLESCADGYRIHDWHQHNRPKKPQLTLVPQPTPQPACEPLAKPAPEPAPEPVAEPVAEPVCEGPKEDLRRTHGGPTVSAPPETIEEVAVSRAYALTQDPREEERSEPPTGERAVPAMPPPAPPGGRPGPRQARPRDDRAATLRKELGRAERERRLVSIPVSPRVVTDAVKRAQAMADLEGLDFATAAARLADGACEMVQKRHKALRWALQDWQPGQASSSGGGSLLDPFSARPGRMPRAPARGPEYFGDAESFARQLAVIRGGS